MPRMKATSSLNNKSSIKAILARAAIYSGKNLYRHFDTSVAARDILAKLLAAPYARATRDNLRSHDPRLRGWLTLQVIIRDHLMHIQTKAPPELGVANEADNNAATATSCCVETVIQQLWPGGPVFCSPHASSLGTILFDIACDMIGKPEAMAVIHTAIQRNHAHSVMFMYSNGWPIASKDIIEMAADAGHLNILLLFMRTEHIPFEYTRLEPYDEHAPKDLYERDHGNNRLLYIARSAIQHGHLHILDFIVKQYVQTTASCSWLPEGFSLAVHAARVNNPAAIQLLYEHNVISHDEQVSVMRTLAAQGNTPLLMNLRDCGFAWDVTLVTAAIAGANSWIAMWALQHLKVNDLAQLREVARCAIEHESVGVLQHLRLIRRYELDDELVQCILDDGKIKMLEHLLTNSGDAISSGDIIERAARSSHPDTQKYIIERLADQIDKLTDEQDAEESASPKEHMVSEHNK